MTPDNSYLKSDPWAAKFMEQLGMTPQEAMEASERLSIRVIDGRTPEPHAVAEIEAAWWGRGKR